LPNLLIPLLTGLTTGGLSCLMVQGGLLTTSIARQAEQDSQRALHSRRTAKHQAAPPIFIFLVAKLIAYTALGFLLGALGSLFQISQTAQAIVQLLIGIWMIGMALNLLRVHPIFRYFVIEPPRFVTRTIRRVARNSQSDMATPALLGAFTVLIPCGVTQTMMALAIGSGNAWAGAAIMFAFTLGASPLFFTLAYLATRLGERIETQFSKIAALAVFVLALVSIEGGLNLLGSPLSFAAITESLSAASAPQLVAAAPTCDPTISSCMPAGFKPGALGNATPVAGSNSLTIDAKDNGYTPNLLRAKAGQPIKLNVVTSQNYACTSVFTVPSLGIRRVLPPTGATAIDLPPQRVGTLRFTCGMGMYSGRIQFE